MGIPKRCIEPIAMSAASDPAETDKTQKSGSVSTINNPFLECRVSAISRISEADLTFPEEPG